MRTFAVLIVSACIGACTERPVITAEKCAATDNDHAEHFAILRRGDERMLLVFGPGGRQDTIGRYHLRGHDKPTDDATFTALPDPDRIAVMSSSHLVSIRALDLVNRIVGVSGTDRVRDPVVRGFIREGSIREVGSADGVDREKLLAVHAQVVLDHPFGRASRSAAMEGIVHIEITEYLEEHPLGRAEWIRFFGVLFDRERTADSLYEAIATRYVNALIIDTGAPRPRVFFGSHWQGQWYVPPGNSYMARLIEDAGGIYAFADRKEAGNIAVDVETVITEGRKADRFGVIIGNGGKPTADLIAGGDRRIASLPSVQKGSFVLDSEISDIFGQALLEPDILLHDLACVIDPDRCGDRPLRYVQRVVQ